MVKNICDAVRKKCEKRIYFWIREEDDNMTVMWCDDYYTGKWHIVQAKKYCTHILFSWNVVFLFNFLSK